MTKYAVAVSLFLVFSFSTSIHAVERFVLVVSGGHPAPPGGCTGPTDSRCNLVYGTCMVVSGRGSSSQQISLYVPGVWAFETADLVSCALQWVPAEFDFRPVVVELRRGGERGQMVARTTIQGNDIVSIAGH